MLSRSLRVLALAGFLGVSSMVSAAMAAETPAPAAPPSPKFDIREFKVEGNTLLPENEVLALVKPHAGLSRDFGDVQLALEALQAAYQKKGYGAVQVLLPEQELEAGVVRLRVVEQHVSMITVEGNEHYDDENILRAVPSVKVGAMPNMKAVQASLKVANENPSKQTAILFRSNDDEESVVDVTVKVIDDKPWKAFLTVDNTGSRETGQFRIGLGYQNYNLWNKDHRVTVQYITNNHFPDSYFNPDKRVNILGGAYTIPFYEWGDSLDLLAGYSDVNSGKLAAGAISVTGKGLILGAHYNHNFSKIGEYDHKLTGAVDYRAYRNDMLNDGNTVDDALPHISSIPLSVNYSGLWQIDQRRLSFNVGGSWNALTDLAQHGKESLYTGSPYLAEQNFRKLTVNVDYVQPFAKTWQFHAGFDGQLTEDHLIPGEQFRAGGMDSVRGWHESVVSGDKGYRASVEFISPDFGSFFSENVGMRGLVFLEGAYLDMNRDTSGRFATERDEKTISSLGGGLRYNYKRDIVARFDLAYVIDGDMPKDRSTGSREQGDTFGHVSVGWIW